MKSFCSVVTLALATGAFAQSPSTAWTFATGGPIRSQPLVTPDRVFLTSGDGWAYALDRRGGLVWKTPLGGGSSWASPSLGDDGLAVVSGGSTLQLLEPRSGRVLWTLTTGPDATTDQWDYHHSRPLWLPGRIIFGSGDGFLYSVEPATGTVQWKTDTRSEGTRAAVAPAHSSPVWAQDTLYFASALGDVWAIEPTTGKKRARLSLGGRIDATPVVDSGQLFVGSRNTRFHAVTLEPFEETWSYVSPAGSWMTSTAAVWGDLVVAGSSDDRQVSAWDRRTGDLVWQAFVDGNVFSGVTVTPRAVLATSGDAYRPGQGHLYALAPSDGEVLWSLDLEGNSWATPAWDGREIFVADESGILRVMIF